MREVRNSASISQKRARSFSARSDPAQALALLEQLGDGADLDLDGPPARLGGVGGEDGVELEPLEQQLRLGRSDLVDEPAVGPGHLVDRVGRRVEGDLALALVEGGDAVVLLAQVGEVEVGGEGPGEQLGVAQRQAVDERDRLPERRPPARAAVRCGVRGGAAGLGLHADGFGLGAAWFALHADGFALGAADVAAQAVERLEQVAVVLPQRLPQQAQADPHVALEALGEPRPRRRGYGCEGGVFGNLAAGEGFRRCRCRAGLHGASWRTGWRAGAGGWALAGRRGRTPVGELGVGRRAGRARRLAGAVDIRQW